VITSVQSAEKFIFILSVGRMWCKRTIPGTVIIAKCVEILVSGIANSAANAPMVLHCHAKIVAENPHVWLSSYQ
jgi:hypothetical protein